jgi:transposase-like protein
LISIYPILVFIFFVLIPYQEDEVRKLRRELAIVKQERDLLKKAAAYFAKISL